MQKQSLKTETIVTGTLPEPTLRYQFSLSSRAVFLEIIDNQLVKHVSVGLKVETRLAADISRSPNPC